MAQTGGRSGAQATGQRVTNETTTSTAANSTPSATRLMGAAGTLGAWRERASAFLAPRPMTTSTTSAGAKGQPAGAGAGPQRPSTGKVMLGMLAFVAGAELLLFVVQFADVRFFKGYLELHTVASRSTPILGGMTWFLLILMLLTLGLWIGLNRLGIIQPLTPRPPAGARAGTVAGRSGAAATTPGAGGRNRAARRLAQANATTSASGSAKGTTAKGGAGKAVAVSASAASGSGSVRASGANDAVYQRVKAAQRSRKRRASKR